MAEAFKDDLEVRTTDVDKAHFIGLAIHELQTLHVAANHVDQVLASFNGDCESVSFNQQLKILKELESIREIYPEAFKHVATAYAPNGDSGISFQGLQTIIENDGVPLTSIASEYYQKQSTKDLEKEIETRELIAEALYDTPPSEDFVRDYGLGGRHGEFYRETTSDLERVEIVYGLLESAASQEAATNRHKNTYKGLSELYESDHRRQPKMGFMLSMLERVSIDVEHIDNTEFEDELIRVLNDSNTTLGDLESIYTEGVRLVIESSVQKAEQQRQIFGAIISGDAADYSSGVE